MIQLSVIFIGWLLFSNTLIIQRRFEEPFYVSAEGLNKELPNHLLLESLLKSV